ncbi:hypothetical protein PMAYCL1PPCAC_24070, partial [Pristionchus mayeri]
FSPLRGVMPRSSISLLLPLFLSSLPSSLAVECEACEGSGCTSSKPSYCVGDYCVSSLFNPKWGKSQSVRGCISGDMLAEGINAGCESDGENETCICSTKHCTSRKNKKKLKSEEQREKITCSCTKGAKGCDRGKCTGDLCVWTSHINKDLTVKGCLDYSLPLLEQRAIDSCSLPPISPSTHFIPLGNIKEQDSLRESDLLNMESCICSTNMCNLKKPFKLTPKEEKLIDVQKCNRSVSAVIKGENEKTKVKTCLGEFCYKMGVTVKGKGQYSYVAEGCATFNPERKMAPLFGTGKCAHYEGKSLVMRSCYETKDEGALERLENSVTREEKEEEYEGEQGENEGEEEEEEEVNGDRRGSDNGKDGKSNGKKEDTKEERGDEEEGEAVKEKGEKEEKEEKEKEEK